MKNEFDSLLQCCKGLIDEELVLPALLNTSSSAQVTSYVSVEEMDTIVSLLGDEDLEKLSAPTSFEADTSATSEEVEVANPSSEAGVSH